MKNQKRILFILFSIALVDMIGIGLVIPFLPLVLKNPDFFSKVPPYLNNLLTGALLSTYPLFQFFGSPILGKLSDRFGRKKVLLISLFGSFLGYLIFPLGLWFKSLSLLFLSRAIDGFTGGNVSTVMASITDISQKKDRTKNYALIGTAFGFGFIIGPALGGFLSNPKLFKNLAFEAPFLASAGITLLNLLLVSLFLPETLRKREEKIELKKILKQSLLPLSGILRYKNLQKTFLAIFLTNLGWSLFVNYFQIYLWKKFSLHPSKISSLFAYVGIWIVISQAGLVRKFSNFEPKKVLKIALPLNSFVLALLIFLPSYKYLFFVLPFLAITRGFSQPNFSSLLTYKTSPKQSGEVLGLRQSILSLTQILGPLTGGLLLNLGYTVPLISGAILVFIGWILI